MNDKCHICERAFSCGDARFPFHANAMDKRICGYCNRELMGPKDQRSKRLNDAVNRLVVEEINRNNPEASPPENCTSFQPWMFPLRLVDDGEGYEIWTSRDDAMGSRNNFAILGMIQHIEDAQRIRDVLNDNMERLCGPCGGVKDQPLKCEVEGGELVIRIGIGTLAWAAAKENGGPLDKEEVTHEDLWAADVYREIVRENEVGTSLLSGMLDEAMWQAANHGSVGLTYPKK